MMFKKRFTLLAATVICAGGITEGWAQYTEVLDIQTIPSAQPRRDDPQPDTLFYDDGRGVRLVPMAVYSGVWFTAPVEFELRSIYLRPRNPRNNRDLGCNVYVYTANRNGVPRNEIWSTWVDPPIPDGWLQVDIPEDEYIEFDEGENFNIIYGPSSNDNYPGNAGDGWWNFIDEASNVNRSIIAQDLGGQWSLLGGDLLIRAGGEILAEFVDLGVDAVANESEKFFLTFREPISFYAEVTNYGTIEVEDFTVTFSAVIAGENDEIWSNTVQCGRLDVGESMRVEAEEEFEAFDDLVYYVWAQAAAEGDANDDNDRSGLEQTVASPDTLGGAGGLWFGYTDGHTENGLRLADDGGFGVMFYSPDDQPT
ncbi:MAG: hypothetical protein V2A61_07945, partial [Calditrichota bacterium]